MKYIKYVLLAALVAAVLPLTVQSKVKDTPHNLNNQGINVSAPGGTNQVCMPCHTPHFALLPGEHGYLWNHELPDDGEWILFSAEVDKQSILDAGSRLCLSCHDGTVALDAYGLPDGGENSGTVFIPANKQIGPDLQTHHPIGVEYPLGSGRYEQPTINDPDDPDFDANFSVVSSDPDLADSRGASIVEGTVQCESCHFAHGGRASDGRMFLRVGMNESQLCSQCHVN